MTQVTLIAQIETLRKFIIDNLSLDINQMAQSEYLLDFIKDNIDKTNRVIFQTSIDSEIQALILPHIHPHSDVEFSGGIDPAPYSPSLRCRGFRRH